jgi:acyl-CoA synthetase (AMP-forming)/AMP-acid ligase II
MHLTMLLDMAVEGFGDRPVVGTNATGLTARELRRRALAGARLLRDRNADALVYLATNGPAYPVALFAAAHAGLPLVPLNYRLGAAQLTDLLARHPRAVVIAEERVREHVEQAGLEQLSVQEWLHLTASGSPQAPGAAARADSETPDPAADGAAAVVIYTSGTTSSPKGVLLRHQHLVSYVFGTVEFAAASEDDVALICVPPYHIAAVANVISNLFAGRRTVILGHFDAAGWLETVRTEQVTNALVVPTMLARIVSCDGDLSVTTLRTLAYGGAPMPRRVIEKALALWPEVGFVNAYGLTETSSTVAVLGPEEHRQAIASTDPRVRARLTSVGRVIPTVELRILDDSGNEVPPGTVGRICLRGDQVSAEYDGIGVAVNEQGFFDTRDKGYLDEDGFLFIGGRVDDTIIRGGENIAPAEIEAVLLEDPAVLDVAVIGVPDDEWGQRIEAVMVPAPGCTVDPGALRDLVRRRLRSSKTPDRIHVVPQLPRTETGKLIRRRVAALIADAAAGSRPASGS